MKYLETVLTEMMDYNNEPENIDALMPQPEDMGIIKAGGNSPEAKLRLERALKMLW